MKLERLAQPPYETTLMGVVHGALAYHGLEPSGAGVFGGSGHAFALNIHAQLCPSSPYVWNMSRVMGLLRDLGVEMDDLGFFHGGSGEVDRRGVEAEIRAALDAGVPCALCNMDYQLVYGYDDRGFLTARPWPANPDYPPGRLTFGSWAEFGDEVHVNFFRLPRTVPSAPRDVLRGSLAWAVDAWRHPEAYAVEGYAFGPLAYERWLAAIAEHGGTHGHWWNATVWSECRSMGAAYLADAVNTAPKSGPALTDLSATYGRIGELLGRASARALGADEKRALIAEARQLEEPAIDTIGAVLKELLD